MLKILEAEKYIIHLHMDETPHGVLAARDMRIGQLGIVEEGPYTQQQHVGSIVLRTYCGVVSLNHPNSTWDSPRYMVHLLKTTDAITFIVK